MEVVINVGELKAHTAVVLNTRITGDNTLIDVQTTTKVENVALTLEEKHVTHLQ
jgi:hypothetical protein